MNMRHTYLALAIAGAAASLAYPAAAAEPDRSPTGNITQRPRTVDELGFSRTNQQDSVLAGGVDWTPPPVTIANPCVANPALCEEPPVGEPPPPVAGGYGGCGFVVGAPHGPSQAMRIEQQGGNGIFCAQGGQYNTNSGPRPNPMTRFNVQARFTAGQWDEMADLSNPAIWSITWDGHCIGTTGPQCTTQPVRVSYAEPVGVDGEDAAWSATVRMVHLATGATTLRSFGARYMVCGAVGSMTIECR